MKNATTLILLSLMLLSATSLKVYGQVVDKKTVERDYLTTNTIAHRILKMLNGVTTQFEGEKGTLIEKKDDGTMVYNVHNDSMYATTQIIMTNAHGNSFYIARYSGSMENLVFAQAALSDIPSFSTSFTIREDDVNSTRTRKITYLYLGENKVGSYILDYAKLTGTLIIGFQ